MIQILACNVFQIRFYLKKLFVVEILLSVNTYILHKMINMHIITSHTAETNSLTIKGEVTCIQSVTYAYCFTSISQQWCLLLCTHGRYSGSDCLLFLDNLYLRAVISWNTWHQGQVCLLLLHNSKKLNVKGGREEGDDISKLSNVNWREKNPKIIQWGSSLSPQISAWHQQRVRLRMVHDNNLKHSLFVWFNSSIFKWAWGPHWVGVAGVPVGRGPGGRGEHPVA